MSLHRRMPCRPGDFFVSFVALEAMGKALAGDAGRQWFADEIGILVTGAFWLAAGLLLMRAAVAPAARMR